MKVCDDFILGRKKITSKRRKATSQFKTEADLVSATRDWLVADGWTVYFEVAPWGAGAARADIVAVRGDIVSIVECKMSLSLALLDQCNDWCKYAHFVWASVPGGKRNRFAHKIAEWLGVGIILVGTRYDKNQHKIGLHSKLNRKAVTKEIVKVLCEGQQNTDPGASHSFVTPFRSTCNNLIEKIKLAGGKILVKDAMHSLKHHYRGPASARSSLVKRAKQGFIPGVSLLEENRKLYFIKM